MKRRTYIAPLILLGVGALLIGGLAASFIPHGAAGPTGASPSNVAGASGAVATGSPSPRQSSFPPGGSPSETPGPTASVAPSPSPSTADLARVATIDKAGALRGESADGAAGPARVAVYSGQPSVLPGTPLALRVSTPASTFRVTIFREGWNAGRGPVAVWAMRNIPGHDWRSRTRYDAVHRTVRANWPVSVSVPTDSFKPGVYTAVASDTSGRSSTIFVVRSANLAGTVTFVLPLLDYQAYNLWGGHNLYAYAGTQATRVSFDRPYDEGGGTGFWTRHDWQIVDWLERTGYNLSFTTDYDLSTDPPADAPKVLVLGQHTEYIAAPMRDWLDLHVDRLGDMSIALFGANSLYQQVRIAPGPAGPSAPPDVICDRTLKADPVAEVAPMLATVHWRQPPVNRPEGMLLGSQYVSVLANATSTRYPFTVTQSVPVELLRGTGWRAGTVIEGLLMGEADALYPNSNGISLMTGAAIDHLGHRLRTDVVIRTSAAGGRVFSAGTFGWADGLLGTVGLGVSTASFDGFNRNVLAWLGATPP